MVGSDGDLTNYGGGLKRFGLTQLCLSLPPSEMAKVSTIPSHETGNGLMDIAKLIPSLQAAGEGSEYLDYAIQRQFALMKPVPAYTRSLDAAMQLMPEGWSIHRLGQRHDCRGKFTGWFAELYRARDAVIEFPGDSRGATAPLAICVAAMRVRQGLEDAAAVRDGDVVEEVGDIRHRA